MADKAKWPRCQTNFLPASDRSSAVGPQPRPIIPSQQASAPCICRRATRRSSTPSPASSSSAGSSPAIACRPERELTARLKVSRPTVREALKRWAALGIVEMRVGSGTYLRVPVAPGAVHFAVTVQFEHEHLQRTLELRRALETEAAELAATAADV